MKMILVIMADGENDQEHEEKKVGEWKWKKEERSQKITPPYYPILGNMTVMSISAGTVERSETFYVDVDAGNTLELMLLVVRRTGANSVVGSFLATTWSQRV